MNHNSTLAEGSHSQCHGGADGSPLQCEIRAVLIGRENVCKFVGLQSCSGTVREVIKQYKEKWVGGYGR